MAKSRETFSKKENEKKRLKKKQDKEQKKEDRKSQSNKSLDDMIAYVDENGNLSSTPPDPNKKKAVNEENISISVSRRVDDPEDDMRTGKVTFFNESKGYGFIQDDQNRQSVFVHINALLTPIRENDKVSFQIEIREKGPSAIQVKKI